MEKKRSVGVVISCIMLIVSFFDSAAAADNNINAATVYKEAYSILTNLPKDFTSKEYIQELIKIINDGWKNDNKELKEILISNQVALNEFKKATKLQNCDFTFGKQIKMTATTPVPQFGEPISLVRLVLVEARLYEKENKWDLALNNYISVLRFMHHLNQQENFILLSHIVETITQNLVYTPLAHYVTREDLNSQQCQILFDTLLFMKRNRIGLEKAFEEENEGMKNTIRTIGEEAKQKGEYKESYYQALYNEFDRLQDEFTEYLILAYKENKPEIYKEKVDEFNADLEKAKKPINLAWDSIKGIMRLPTEINPPSLAAKILASLGLGQFSKVITRYYISISKFDILSTAVAIKLYEINNGKTPDSLEELIPSYFKDLPGDPFNNFDPLKYEKGREGWFIYSFGPDKQDNQAKIIHGGKIEDIEKQGDICFSLTRPPK